MMSHKKTYHLQQHITKEDKPKINFSVYKGLLVALLSGVLYASSAAIVKYINNIHPGQLAVYRYIAITIFSFPEAVKCNENILGPKSSRINLTLRTIFGTTTGFLNFIAFRYLPLGESAVIIYSVPVFVTVTAKMLLKELCGIFQFLAVILTVVGIIFTSKIPKILSENSIAYTKESIYGLLCSVGSLFCSTARYIVTRKLKSVHRTVMMFNYGWLAILETVILTFIFGTFQLHNCGIQGLYIIIFGFLNYGAQILLITALLCELAGPVSTMKSASDIVLAFMWQALLFDDIPDLYSSIGAVLVGTSVFLVGLQKWMSSLSEGSPYREKLSWVLK